MQVVPEERIKQVIEQALHHVHVQPLHPSPSPNPNPNPYPKQVFTTCMSSNFDALGALCDDLLAEGFPVSQIAQQMLETLLGAHCPSTLALARALSPTRTVALALALTLTLTPPLTQAPTAPPASATCRGAASPCRSRTRSRLGLGLANLMHKPGP